MAHLKPSLNRLYFAIASIQFVVHRELGEQAGRRSSALSLTVTLKR